jgi:hypothetical protein
MTVLHAIYVQGKDPWVDYKKQMLVRLEVRERISTHIVTRLAWMAARLVSSNNETR